jgi:hypothetical protein
MARITHGRMEISANIVLTALSLDLKAYITTNIERIRIIFIII